MALIQNERMKLLANNLDRASTACLAAGFIAPAATTGISIVVSVSTIIWIISAGVLHLTARRALGGLKA